MRMMDGCHQALVLRRRGFPGAATHHVPLEPEAQKAPFGSWLPYTAEKERVKVGEAAEGQP